MGGSGFFGLISSLAGNFANARRQEHIEQTNYDMQQLADLSVIAFPEQHGLPADAFEQGGMQSRARDKYFELYNKGLPKETKAQAAEIQNIINTAAPMRAAMARADRSRGGSGVLQDSPQAAVIAAKTAAAQGAAPLSTLAPGAGAQPPAARTAMPGTSLPTLAGQAQPGTIPTVSPRIAPSQPYAQMAFTQPTGPPGAIPQSAAMPYMPQSTVAIGAQPAPFGAKPTGSMPAPTGAIPIRQGTPPAILAAPPAVPGAAQAPTLLPSVAATGQTPAAPQYTPPLAVAGKEPVGGWRGKLKGIGEGIGQAFTGQARDVLKGYPTPPPVESLGLTPDEAARQRYKLATSLGMSPEDAQYYALGGKPATPSRAREAQLARFQQVRQDLMRAYVAGHPGTTMDTIPAAAQAEIDDKANARAGSSGPASTEAKDLQWARKTKADPNASADDLALADDILKEARQKSEGREFLNASRKLMEETPPVEVTRFYADIVLHGGSLPAYASKIMGRGGMQAIMNEVPAMAAEEHMSPAEFVAKQADVAGLKKGLANMEASIGPVKAWEATAEQNLQMAIDQAAKIGDTGVPYFNRPVREVMAELGGEELAAFKAAVTVASTEVSRALNNPTGAGVISDTARKESQDILDQDYSLGMLQKAANILKTDMHNRIGNMFITVDAYEQAIQAGGRKPGSAGVNIATSAGLPLPQKLMDQKYIDNAVTQYMNYFNQDKARAIQAMRDAGFQIGQ